ncbi:GNAT family N-acetyltransferase [Candidatus Nanopelagicales bacterium]|nr:GNAT family N-acetyltransferase [Candidatus Nanopelagicales bacterium]
MSEYPEQWEADVVLRDGSTCHMRPIRPTDADRLRRFHSQLSDETIYYRFFAPYPELTAKDVQRFTEVDYQDRVAIVATVAGEIVGVGRYDKVAELNAEVAFTVRDDYQGRGLGSVLLEHLSAAARERGYRRFTADVLPQNRRMAGTFSHAGYRVASELDEGVVKLAFEIEPTDQLRTVARDREQRADSRSIERLLNPESIAVIGASATEGGMGHLALRNLITAGFTGRILPIHPTATEVAGQPAYASVMAAPGPIDLALIVVPVAQVADVVADCGAAGVHGLVVMSSGFADAGPDGTERERALVESVRGHGMRLVGPNALGLINTDPRRNLCAAVPDRIPPRGRVAMFAQSAVVSIAALDRLAHRQLGISSFVSAGNRADVSGEDLLQYWLSETDSDVVMMYLETMADPRKFIRVAHDVSCHKPVVVVRSGRTSQAFPLGPRQRRTELSAAAVDQLVQNTGVLEAGSMDELVDITGMLACQPLPTGKRVSVVGDSHELMILAADTLATAGLQVVSQDYVVGDDRGETMTAALAEPVTGEKTDAVVVVHLPPTRSPASAVREAILKASRSATVPILTILHAAEGNNSLLRYDKSGTKIVEASLDTSDGSAPHGSVPYFGTVEEAVRALAAVVEYAQWRSQPRGEVPDLLEIDSESARAILDEIEDRNRHEPETVVLSQSETSALLHCFGIRLLPARPVASEDAAVAAADAVGWPVVLKTMDPRLARRGATNGARINLESEPALRAAYLSLAATLDAQATSQFVVQRMAPAGAHCVLRTQMDPLFGPVVSFGLGGTIAELLNDHSFRVPPITDADAARLVRDPGAASLLFGYGGNEPADVAALEDLVVRVGVLAAEFPQIARLDLNPIIASPLGPVVLGARAWLRPTEAGTEGEARRLSSW